MGPIDKTNVNGEQVKQNQVNGQEDILNTDIFKILNHKEKKLEDEG